MAADTDIGLIVQQLVGMQSRMADRQVAVENALLQLTNRVDALAEGQAQLVVGQAQLVAGQTQLTKTVGNLATRIDAFTEAVMRGFTDAAGRHGELAAKVTTLDARLTALERERQT